MTDIKLIEHATNPFPGRWLICGRSLLGGRKFHVRCSPQGRTWLFTWWRRP